MRHDPPWSVMSSTHGFAPLAADSARVLVLGTLPSQASVARGEYYAHPHNGFWPIMDALFGVGQAPQVVYAERQRRLIAAGVALWDVCQAAHRPGSLDASIRADSIVANDIPAFLRAHPQLRLIGFNGATAGQLFRRLIWPQLSTAQRQIACCTLPSTSPAHATLRRADKLARWQVLREACQADGPGVGTGQPAS